ncbi:MAG: hypothetical protein ACW99Q_06490 [Candidatus Kariarchaeaceae archaeon]
MSPQNYSLVKRQAILQQVTIQVMMDEIVSAFFQNGHSASSRSDPLIEDLVLRMDRLEEQFAQTL